MKKTFALSALTAAAVVAFGGEATAQGSPIHLQAGEVVTYEMVLPEGTYTFSVSSSTGDPDVALDDAAGNELAIAKEYGDDQFTLTLSAGTYRIVYYMSSCVDFFFGECALYDSIDRQGDPDFGVGMRLVSNSGGGDSSEPEIVCEHVFAPDGSYAGDYCQER